MFFGMGDGRPFFSNFLADEFMSTKVTESCQADLIDYAGTNKISKEIEYLDRPIQNNPRYR